MEFRSSLPLMKPGAEAGGELPVPLDEPVCRLSFFFFLLLCIPALGPQPAGRRGQASGAEAAGPFLLHLPRGWGNAEAVPRAAVCYHRPGMEAQAGERREPLPSAPAAGGAGPLLHLIPPHPTPAYPTPSPPSPARLCPARALLSAGRGAGNTQRA